MSSVEKALLLYVEAGIFYDKAGNKSSAVLMFRQMLEAINSYLRVAKYMNADEAERQQRFDIIKSHLDEIQAFVNYSLQILYGHYDSVNVLEIEKLKDLYGKDVDEDINLHSLPLSPDIEELIYRYYSIELRCKKTDCIKYIYTSNLMGRYKQISTLSQDIQNLRLKFMMNEKLFEEFVGIRRDGKILSSIDLVSHLKSYFINNDRVFEILENYNIDSQKKNFFGKVDLLNYLIVDNLSCLSKIANALQPLNNPTIFTSCFLGDVNLYTEFWKRLYESLYLLYKDADIQDTYSKSLKDCWIKSENHLNNNKEYDKIKDNDEYKTLRHFIVVHKGKEQLGVYLKQYFESRIGSLGGERLSWNYNAELAILNYNKAIETHTEGRAYKEMITSLYFLDDDLNNDTIQQHWAIERYLINSGNIRNGINCMKKRLQTSRIFDINNYIKKQF